MRLTARRLNRATLARQLLLDRQPLPLVEGVRRVVALQAQEPASPYIAMWNRLTGFDPADLDRAFADGDVLKASLMRITLHAVDADDYRDFHQAMQVTLRASRLHDRRFTSSGMSIEEADALVPHLVAFTDRPRSKEEIEAMLGDRLGAQPDRSLWWALRTYALVVHAPTGGAWSFGAKPMYAAAPVEPAEDTEEAVRRLIVRYLEGFGPASHRDLGQYAMLRQPTTKPALEALAGVLHPIEGPGGTILYDVADGPVPEEDTPAPPRLLGMWDSVLLAYADRSRVLPEEYRRVVIQRNGDVLPTILVDGFVAGVWRPVGGRIEAMAFSALGRATWEDLAVEADGLTALLADRDPDPYARYARWWDKLPGGEVRMLSG